MWIKIFVHRGSPKPGRVAWRATLSHHSQGAEEVVARGYLPEQDDDAVLVYLVLDQCAQQWEAAHVAAPLLPGRGDALLTLEQARHGRPLP